MRLARAAIASVGLVAMVLGSTASAAVRPGDSVVAPTANAAAGIAIDRQGSVLGTSEDLRGKPVVTIVVSAVVLAILIALLTGSDDPESP
jgi:hypothetical protein